MPFIFLSPPPSLSPFLFYKTMEHNQLTQLLSSVCRLSLYQWKKAVPSKESKASIAILKHMRLNQRRLVPSTWMVINKSFLISPGGENTSRSSAFIKVSRVSGLNPTVAKRSPLFSTPCSLLLLSYLLSSHLFLFLR